ncbi:hypothetical protein Ancab_037458 [Ancistrocladus abbreviatus]
MAAQVVDGSFKKPGAVPFKWEIKPGVPKFHPLHPDSVSVNHRRESLTSTPQKLTPPPSGSCFTSQPVLKLQIFPSTRSEQEKLDRPILAQPQLVSAGCLFMSLFRRKYSKNKGAHKIKLQSERGNNHPADFGTLARCSISTRKPESPLWARDSPSFSSSHRSSPGHPRPVHDVDWAGFGLF